MSECLILVANLTMYFVAIGGLVIGMTNGLKLESLETSDSLEYDRYWNRWNSLAGRNLVLVLVQDLRGKVSGASAILPVNFHGPTSALCGSMLAIG